MNIKKTLFAACLASLSLCASAQEVAKVKGLPVYKDTVVYDVVPGWYVQGQIGGQYTLGEISFGKLISPNAQVAVGYTFGNVVGARLAVNAWQSKAGSNIAGVNYKWKWNNVSPTIDVMFNLSNLISGVNPKRLVDVSAFVGAGVNIGFNNCEAKDVDAALRAAYGVPEVGTLTESQYLRLLWHGTKVRAMGQIGALVDFKVSKKVSVNLELSANTLADGYNSKMAGNTDWYFNGLFGLKYNFGKVYKERLIEAPKPVIEYREKIVEKIVEKPVEVKVVDTVDVSTRPKLHVEVFFNLAAYKLLGSDAMKVQEAANYMKKYTDAKLRIVGLCDKGTGTDAINNPLSQKRAELVKDILVKKYGIPADRIEAIGKGSTIQPYDIPELNRIAICDAE